MSAQSHHKWITVHLHFNTVVNFLFRLLTTIIVVMVTADGTAASLIAVFAMAPNNYNEQIMKGYAVFVKFEKFIFYLAVD